MNTNREMRSILTVLLASLFVAQSACGFYDSGVGRWINRDPIGDEGFRVRLVSSRPQTPAESTYVFSANDPIDKLDPNGLNPNNYGNWCGTHNSNNGPPIDEVDRACQDHDECLADPKDFFNFCNQIVCNAEFCKAVRNADCRSSPNPSKCRQEKQAILTVCAIFSGGLTAWIW
jgi:hypothetical protein